jgi:hypothetical protein
LILTVVRYIQKIKDVLCEMSRRRRNVAGLIKSSGLPNVAQLFPTLIVVYLVYSRYLTDKPALIQIGIGCKLKSPETKLKNVSHNDWTLRC